MRPSYVLASLLLLFSFLSDAAQGIRWENLMKPIGQQLEETLAGESQPTEEEGFKKIALCRDGHCSSGKSRKLLTVTSPSPSPSILRSEEEGERKANPKQNEEKASGNNKEKDLGNSQPSSENLEAGLEHYSDLVDIAEMDYSPVKRKPPIHN